MTSSFEIYGEHWQWPPHVRVAEIIAAYFPASEFIVSKDSSSGNYVFKLEGNDVLLIDDVGWKFTSGARGWTWSSIKEGSLEAVARDILYQLATDGFTVYNPPRSFDFGNQPSAQERTKRRIIPRKVIKKKPL
jgi:hypothetical protein